MVQVVEMLPHGWKVSNIGFITVHGLNEGHIAPSWMTRICFYYIVNIMTADDLGDTKSYGAKSQDIELVIQGY